MTTATLESVITPAETNQTGWSYESCKLWLSKRNWTLDALEYLIENELADDEFDDDYDDEFDDDDSNGERNLPTNILHEVAMDFWSNTPSICPNARTLVRMAENNNFTDDCMFYDADAWITGTSKRFQSKFLWEFWAWGSPCELNSMVVALTQSEDLYIRCLASMVRANEQIDSGYLDTEGGIDCLKAAYEALTSKEFIIRIKQGQMLSSHVARTIYDIEYAIREYDDFTDEQKQYLPAFLREQGIINLYQ